ncbi:MAG: FHA domain-containing protein [Pyrinomonadaceae bacterium]
MVTLILKFKTADGVEHECEVVEEQTVIGRHSDCDIVIAEGRLSREHAKIWKFGDVFTITDLDSSNGTIVNGEKISEPHGFRKGDTLSLGGFDVEVLLESDQPEDDESGDASKDDDENGGASATPTISAVTGLEQEQASSLKWVFIAAPLLGLLLLVGFGIVAVVYLKPNGEVAQNDPPVGRETTDPIYGTDEATETPYIIDDGNVSESPGTTPTPEATTETNGQQNGGPDVTPIVIENQNGKQSGSNDTDRTIESAAYSFLKRIAKNDQRPFLKTKQLEEVKSQANRFKSSSAIAANIRSANQNAGRIKEIAAAKNLQPQFVAAAAMAKLGGSSGDVAATASSMSETLDKLTIVLGNELSDDSLLVIAAYSEGEAGNTLAMRDRIANLTKKNPNNTAREIRSIWFLRENNEISAAQYDFALRFLAIGTITQNPKAFGVNSAALTLN